MGPTVRAAMHGAVGVGAMTETIRLRKAFQSIRFARARLAHETQPGRLLADLADAFVEVRALLHDLGVATLAVDAEGRVQHASGGIALRGGIGEGGVRGRGWQEVLDLDGDGLARMREVMQRPESRRERLLLTMGGRATSVDVRDDPRDRRGRIVFLFEPPALRGESGEEPPEDRACAGMIGLSPAMQQLEEFVRQVAKGDWTVLIEGETGSGKELVARAIHEASDRSRGPFVPVNCAGLTDSLLGSQLFGHVKGAFTGATSDREGLFEAADGGTLFLDEIGDVSPGVQTSLLRALQDKAILRVGDTRTRNVDVRIIVATHRDLGKRVEEGQFREDLLYRIRVARVRVPPLRDRREDIPLLAEAFLEPMLAMPGRGGLAISPAALDALVSHDWPGNVRELKSAVEHAVIHCRTGVIEPWDLPPEVSARQASPEASKGVAAEVSTDRVIEALRLSGGNRTRAARMLRIGRATLYRRLHELELERRGHGSGDVAPPSMSGWPAR